MTVPEGTLIDINEIKRFPHEQITIVSTGSQGEPMSALYRMAISSHDKVELGPRDLVVISAHAIPGNERLVNKIINEIFRCGAAVYRDPVAEVHVSGHACQEELKMMMALAKPKFFMPIHGEYKHLIRNKELAQYMGIEDRNIFISDIGKVLELDAESAKFGGTVASGKVLVDGYGVGDVGNIVLRDRRLLSQDGLIVVVATVDVDDRSIISGPDIVSRGFVYVRESEDLMEQIRVIARDAIEDCLENNVTDWSQLKSKVKEDLSKALYAKTHRKPMILPVVMNV